MCWTHSPLRGNSNHTSHHADERSAVSTLSPSSQPPLRFLLDVLNSGCYVNHMIIQSLTCRVPQLMSLLQADARDGGSRVPVERIRQGHVRSGRKGMPMSRTLFAVDLVNREHLYFAACYRT